jgi:hypothetical protein
LIPRNREPGIAIPPVVLDGARETVQ